MTTPIPRPGQHLPGPHTHAEQTESFADPQRVRSEVDELLGQLDHYGEQDGANGRIPHRARVLEQAHDVLVRALATVDKI